MKVYGGMEMQLHLFFPLALDGGASSALCCGCITPGKEPMVPIEWEADWAPALFWTLWSRKMSVALLGIKLWFHVHPAHNLVSIMTMLSWLFYIYICVCVCVCRCADKFCLHCHIFIYIRHVCIEPVLCSDMVSLFHHISPWTHTCLQSSPSAHWNERVFQMFGSNSVLLLNS